jgi:predicted nucleic acid-binding protein
MASSIKRIYWDACCWIALIQQEVVTVDSKSVDRGKMCRGVIQAGERGIYEIVTSTLSLAEVSKAPSTRTAADDDKIAQFFENDYILLANVDVRVGTLARQLMQKGFAGLKPADAIHLATASVAESEFFHTFDNALLKLSAKVNTGKGQPIQITEPEVLGKETPLLKGTKDKP